MGFEKCPKHLIRLKSAGKILVKKIQRVQSTVSKRKKNILLTTDQKEFERGTYQKRIKWNNTF